MNTMTGFYMGLGGVSLPSLPSGCPHRHSPGVSSLHNPHPAGSPGAGGSLLSSDAEVLPPPNVAKARGEGG